jgi:hypothetical protein
VFRLRQAELHKHTEQKNETDQAGTQKVLQVLPQARFTQGNEVGFRICARPSWRFADVLVKV